MSRFRTSDTTRRTICTKIRPKHIDIRWGRLYGSSPDSKMASTKKTGSQSLPPNGGSVNTPDNMVVAMVSVLMIEYSEIVLSASVAPLSAVI